MKIYSDTSTIKRKQLLIPFITQEIFTIQTAHTLTQYNEISDIQYFKN